MMMVVSTNTRLELQHYTFLFKPEHCKMCNTPLSARASTHTRHSCVCLLLSLFACYLSTMPWAEHITSQKKKTGVVKNEP